MSWGPAGGQRTEYNNGTNYKATVEHQRGNSLRDHMRPDSHPPFHIPSKSLTPLVKHAIATATARVKHVSSDHVVHTISRRARHAFLPLALTADAVSQYASHHKSLFGLSVKAFPRL